MGLGHLRYDADRLQRREEHAQEDHGHPLQQSRKGNQRYEQACGDGEWLVRVGTENRQHVLGHVSLLGYDGKIIAPMNYDQFRTVWHEALGAAGLISFPSRPLEAVHLDWLSRTYKTIVTLGAQQVRPFHVTATLSWEWDAALAARSATTEEDLLIEVLGEDGYYLVTQRPWLRIDVSLSATLPADSAIPMPDRSAWRRWAAKVKAQVAPLLPIESVDAGHPLDEEHDLRILSSRSEPAAQLRCDPDTGRLYLTGVELSAWQGIDLPRQWDNPDRELDPWPDSQLADFAGRVREALLVWEECLDHLHSPATR